jgi:hypothetical protein
MCRTSEKYTFLQPQRPAFHLIVLRVVNTHPERRRLEFSKTQHEEQGTLPTTNIPTLITRPAEPHSHDMCRTPQRKSSRASRPPAWHSDYNMD